MKKPMTKAVLGMLAAMMALSACETTEGLGRDTQKLGNNIERSAEKHDLDNDPNN